MLLRMRMYVIICIRSVTIRFRVVFVVQKNALLSANLRISVLRLDAYYRETTRIVHHFMHGLLHHCMAAYEE
jgi:hypothetical protein